MRKLKSYISILILTVLIFTNAFSAYPSAFASNGIDKTSQKEEKINPKQEEKKIQVQDESYSDLKGREKTELIVKFKDDETSNLQQEMMANKLTTATFQKQIKKLDQQNQKEREVVFDEVKGKLRLEKLDIKKNTNTLDKKSTSSTSMRMESSAFQSMRNEVALEQIPSEFEILEIDDSDSIQEVIEALESYDEVEFAQPNYKLSLFEIIQIEEDEDVETTTATMQEQIETEDETTESNETTTATMQYQITDPKFEEQWGHYNTGQEIEGVEGTEGIDINVVDAWNLSMGSSDVVIGVLDTGIDINHEDLANNIYINENEIPNNGIDDDGNGYIDDVNGWDFYNADATVYDSASNDKHGTHVAGIIAAEANDIGIVGVAPNVKVLPLKFMQGDVGYTSDAIEAIAYAEAMGVKVMNCSFGSYDYNYALADAIENSDMLFVCAAGNDGKNNDETPMYPASYTLKNVLSITAIDNNGNLDASSNYGESVDVAAPGVDIYSTRLDNAYGYGTGSSQAAAYGSGVAALLLSQDASRSASDLRSIIKYNNQTLSSLDGLIATSAMIDAYTALNEGIIIEEAEELPTSDEKIEVLVWMGETLDAVNSIDEIDEIDLQTLLAYLETDAVTFKAYAELIGDYETFKQNITDQYFSGMSFDEGYVLYTALSDKENFGLLIVDYETYVFSNGYHFYDAQELVEYMNGGYDLGTIYTALHVANALEVKLDEVIRTIEPAGNYLTEEEKLLAEDYYIDIEKLNIIRQSRGCTWEEIYTLIEEYSPAIPSDEGIMYAMESAVTEVAEVDYKSYLKSPFQYQENVNESISPIDGSLRFEKNLYNFDTYGTYSLLIGLVYSSNDAAVYRMNSRKRWTSKYYYVYRNVQKDEYEGNVVETYYGKGYEKLSDALKNNPSHFNEKNAERAVYITKDHGSLEYNEAYKNHSKEIGTGWELNLPKLVISSTESKNSPGYATFDLGNGITGQIKTTYKSHDKRTVDFFGDQSKYENLRVDYKRKAVQFKNSVIKETCIIISDKDYIYYFNLRKGGIRCIKDRFGNEVMFNYEESERAKLRWDLTEIVDEQGNCVTIDYNYSGDYLDMVFHFPDGTSSTVKEEQYEGIKSNNIYKVSQIVDQEGNAYKFNYYDYNTYQTEGSMNGRETYSLPYMLLESVQYPTGASTNYSYEKGMRNNPEALPVRKDNDGGYIQPYEEYYKINTRKDIVDSKNYNIQSYSYENDPSGYPVRYAPLEHASIIYRSQNFRCYTTITQSDGLKSHYEFDAYGKIRKEFIYDGTDLLKTTESEYDDIQQLSKKTIQQYDGAKSSEATVKQYQFNEYRNLVKYTDENGHTTVNVYHDGDGLYNKLLKSSTQLDSGKDVTITYDYYNAIYGPLKAVRTDYKTVDGSTETQSHQYVWSDDGYKTQEEVSIDNSKTATINYSYDFGITNDKNQTVDRKTQSVIVTNQSISSAGIVSSIDQTWSDKTDIIPGTNKVVRYENGTGDIWRYDYDELSRLTTFTNIDGSEKNIAYDDANNILIATDEDGLKSKIVYDGLGNELKTYLGYEDDTNTLVWDKLSEKTYDSLCRVSTVQDALGNTTSYDYDVLGRVIKTTNPDNTNITVDYQDTDFKVVTTNEEGHDVTESFDIMGNKIMTEAEDGNGNTLTSTFDYDYVGNLTSSTDGEGNTTDYTYDELSRLIKVVNPLSETTKYYYDHLGNMTKQVYPDGKIQENTFNELGQLLSNTDMYGKTQYTCYNLDGTVAKILDRNGDEQTFTYDDKLRLETHTGKDFGFTYSYHNNDRIQSVDQVGYGAISYTYQNDGKLSQKTTPDGKTTGYTYDGNGNIDTLTTPFGLTVNYDYNARNQINTLTANGKVFDYNYYDDGMISGLNYPTNKSMTSNFTYDNVNRLTALNSNGLNQTSNFGYSYDNNSNIVSVAGIDGSHSYGYDVLNRLTQVDRTTYDRHTSFTYDTLGNRASARGDLEFLIPTTKAEYGWNGLNQLTSYTDNNTSQTSEYQYDYTGIRTKKETPNGTTKYYTDEAGRVIAEADANGNAKAQIIWGHKPLARVVDNTWYFYVYNGHGDVVQMVDEAGNVVNRYSYDEWGNIIAESETVENPIRYAGEFYDEESGHYYLRARYYDPVTARFISRDTYGGTLDNPLSHNLYSYCFNNPLVFVDPSGHEGFSLNMPNFSGLGEYGKKLNAKLALEKKQWEYNTKKGLETIGRIETEAIIFAATDGAGEYLIESIEGYRASKAAGVAAKTLGAVDEAVEAGHLSKWWHPGYIDDLTDSQILLGMKNADKGMSTMGSASKVDVWSAGKSWVGDGAKEILDNSGDVIGYSSSDGMRSFRYQFKSSEGIFRANFEENMMVNTTGGWTKTLLRNVHIDVFK